ncbi:MAG: response regulator [Desulfobacteraceae bacterium]|nr:MAG: response regulator [Desulfobacteraceae bacterium]
MNHKIKVLMVDDEEKFRETTRKILNRRGFDTVMAADGPEALAKLTENPDVVVLDVKLPGMDGHQVLKEIKKRYPRLPVIMLTGHGAMPSAKEALAEGAFDYLAKPCDIDLLASKIVDASKIKGLAGAIDEKKVGEVMIPLAEYTTVKENDSVRVAVQALRDSFAYRISTSRLMETGHRSVLVFNAAGEMTGVLAITDLLSGMMPAYLSASRPSMADSIRYSPLFWHGMFSRAVKEMGDHPVAALMQPAPQTIDAEANLMEAAYMMLTQNIRRLVVRRAGRMAGIIREQELFFEIEKILQK